LFYLVVCKDYYKTLDVDSKASTPEIKKSYKRLALKWHPDKNPDNRDEANIKFQEISEAYSILGDEEKRQKYDKYGDVFSNPQNSRQGATHFNGAGFTFSFGGKPRFSFGDFSKFSSYDGAQPEPIPSQTVDITGSNWDHLTKGSFWMVQFYSDLDCTICKSFSTTWEALATNLTEIINFGRINIRTQPGIKHYFGIHEVPTLVTFYQQQLKQKYTGELKINQIKAFIQDQLPSDRITTFSSSYEWQALFSHNPCFTYDPRVKVILVSDKESPSLLYKALSLKHSNICFYYTSNIIDELKNSVYGIHKTPCLILIKDTEDFVQIFSDTLSAKFLSELLNNNQHLIFPKLSNLNFEEYCYYNVACIVFFMTNGPEFTSNVTRLRNFAAKLHSVQSSLVNRVRFAWIDSEEQESFRKHFGESKMMILYKTAYIVYNGSMNEPDIRAWLEDIKLPSSNTFLFHTIKKHKPSPSWSWLMQRPTMNHKRTKLVIPVIVYAFYFTVIVTIRELFKIIWKN